MEFSPRLVAELLFLVFLLCAGAFFSMSETAFIGVNRHQVRQKAESGDERARRVDRMLDDPERILSTVLVGNTIINISAAALATFIAEQLLHRFATTVAAVTVTLLVLVFAEIVPKTVAVQIPLPLALRLAQPLRVVEIVMRPAVVLSTSIARLVSRPFGIKAKGERFYITEDEVEMFVRMGVEQGHVEKFEQRVIADLFDFTETDVHRLMTPAAKAITVGKDATLQHAAELAGQHGRTRILVVDGDFDHVLGFVHIKDLLRHTDRDRTQLPVTHHLRPALAATSDMPADKLLVQMQREHCLLAIIQEGGNNIGIVTAEDLLEQLVGEITDEVESPRQPNRKKTVKR